MGLPHPTVKRHTPPTTVSRNCLTIISPSSSSFANIMLAHQGRVGNYYKYFLTLSLIHTDSHSESHFLAAPRCSTFSLFFSFFAAPKKIFLSAFELFKKLCSPGPSLIMHLPSPRKFINLYNRALSPPPPSRYRHLNNHTHNNPTPRLGSPFADSLLKKPTLSI